MSLKEHRVTLLPAASVQQEMQNGVIAQICGPQNEMGN